MNILFPITFCAMILTFIRDHFLNQYYTVGCKMILQFYYFSYIYCKLAFICKENLSFMLSLILSLYTNGIKKSSLLLSVTAIILFTLKLLQFWPMEVPFKSALWSPVYDSILSLNAFLLSIIKETSQA